ncbi:MAG: PKD domain-containing protein [Bacteroidota bacterium]
MKRYLALFLLTLPFGSFAQVFWTENFGTGCSQNTLANGFISSNGTWTVTNTGANGAGANQWFVSATEAGMGAGICGNGCLSNGSLTNRTLHIGSVGTSDCGCLICPSGDCGAAYDACNGATFCGVSPQTNKRVESPTINCSGQSTITLNFNYLEGGQGAIDNMTVWYFDGSTWTQLTDPAKTLTNCPGGQGRWAAVAPIALPVSANNNPNVKIGFLWVNNIDGLGSDPSTAIDDITLSSSSGAPPVASFTASSTTICAGGCINFTDNSSGSPTSWSWTFSGGTPGSSTSQNPTNICYATAGTYTATLTATNGFGSSTTSQTITVNALPVPTVSPASPSVCAGSGVSLTASGGSTYTWSPATGLSATTGATVTASPTATQTYTVTAVSAAGCSGTATVTVTVNPLPVASVNPAASSVCSGNGVAITASGGSTYTWSPATGLSATTGATVTASPAATQTYTVTVVSAAGCSATATATVTVNALPSASAGSPVTICNGGNTGLSGSGGVSYSWAPGGSLSCISCQNPTASPTATTTYTVFVTDANGCSASASVTVTVQNCPGPIAAFTASSNSICPNGCVTFTDASTNNPTSWSWSFPGGTPASSTTQNPGSVCWTTPGTYTVSLTVSNINGSSTTTQTITVNNPPTANAGPDVAICAGSSTTLNATGGLSYTWSPATGLSSSTGSSPVASPASTTSYTVTVTDANGCTGTDVVTVTVNTVPTANAGADVTICNGGNTTLNGTGGISYSWAPGGSLSCTTCQSPVANPTSTTTYTLIVTDANGCTGTDMITVTVNPCSAPSAAISASATTGCVFDCFTFTDNSTNSPTAWQWSFQGGTPGNSSLQNPPPVCWAAPGTYTVQLIASNSNGSDTTFITVTINPAPSANAGNDTTISIGNSATLNGSGGGTYSWAPSTGLSCITCQNPAANPTATTTYTLFVTQNGCTDTSTVTVNVVSEFDWFIPSGFSPNGDGQNDIFFVRGDGIKSMKITVYDRIGEKVFESTDINVGWDGTYKGQPLNGGIFVYYATAEFYNGTFDSKKGDVTLFR